MADKWDALRADIEATIIADMGADELRKDMAASRARPVVDWQALPKSTGTARAVQMLILQLTADK